MVSKTEESRLARNFHKTFKPERLYINAMLRSAAAGKSGNAQEIAAETGIPTGTSSGKVMPTLEYCIGMGLVKSSQKRSATRSPELTTFGRMVFLEDPYLKCPITQWLAHMNLCGPVTGADVWYQTFFAGFNALGLEFKREKLETHLSVIYATKPGGLIGPMIGTYEDDAALKICGAISEKNGVLTRREAPLKEDMIRGYGAWLLHSMSVHFPGQSQVSVAELDETIGFKTIPAWSDSSFASLLVLLERKALIEVDRHMDPWLVRPKQSVEEAWKNIYYDMI